MKATKVQNTSTQSQYERVMKKIKKAIGKGQKYCLISGNSPISSTVIQMLVHKGYDVRIVCKANGVVFYFKISWKSAQKGKIGTITKKILPKNQEQLENSKEGKNDVAKTREVMLPEQEPSFWKRLCNFFEPEGEDGMWC